MLNAGSRIVNNWIYPIDKGYILIDTGYESGFAHFKKQLAKMQIVPQQIRYLSPVKNYHQLRLEYPALASIFI